MDDDTVRIVGRQGLGLRAGVRVDEAAREVVLDDEGARRPGGPYDPRPSVRGEHGARGVLEERLTDEDPGPGGPEGCLQQVGADPVGVHRHGDRSQTRGAGGGEHARIGGRFHEDGGSRRGERAQRGGQGALATGGDQDVGPGERGADLPGEPGAQLGQPVGGRPPPCPRPASGPGQGGGQGALGLETGMEVAAVELDHPGRRRGEGDQHTRGVDGTRHDLGAAVAAERDLLPGGVARGGNRGVRLGPEGSGTGPGDDQAFGGELRDGPGDGHRAHLETLDERATRRQLLTWIVAVQLTPQ